jgi:hypothetical protein
MMNVADPVFVSVSGSTVGVPTMTLPNDSGDGLSARFDVSPVPVRGILIVASSGSSEGTLNVAARGPPPPGVNLRPTTQDPPDGIAETAIANRRLIICFP